LQQAGIENAAQEANWLIKYGTYNSGSNLQKLARRRINGEPLQYLLGEWEFYGYPFKVGSGVLIPRPETELLVDLAKEHCNRDSLVYDLCAGSGCVGIVLAKEVKCSVIAVEKSPEAIKYLKQNIELNQAEKRVQVVQCNVLNIQRVNEAVRSHGHSSPLKPIILINPPYLSENEMQSLQKEVTHEPESALFGGGKDGLNFYRNFFTEWKHSIHYSRDLIACEVGDGQAEAVCEMFERVGRSPQIRKDLSGIDRIVYAVP
jgi:release factor glutamine methyltransferase